MNSLTGLFLGGLILIISLSFTISSAFAGLEEHSHSGDLFDFQEHITDVFDIGSGVFSAFVIVISIIAFRNLKSKRVFLITIAFMLFFTRSIFSIFDLLQPETLEVFLSTLSFTGLVFFVLAIFQMGKFKLWKTNSNRY